MFPAPAALPWPMGYFGPDVEAAENAVLAQWGLVVDSTREPPPKAIEQALAGYSRGEVTLLLDRLRRGIDQAGHPFWLAITYLSPADVPRLAERLHLYGYQLQLYDRPPFAPARRVVVIRG